MLKRLRAWIFLGSLLILLASFFYFRLYRYLSIEMIKASHQSLKIWTLEHRLLAVILYNSIFTALIACGIPVATILTLVGGFLFGWIGILYAIFSTLAGGLLLYLAVHFAFREQLSQTAWLRRIEPGLKANAFHYLLTLRLIPIFPCWISNVGAGVFNVPIKTFLLASLIGITPATVIYGLSGRSLHLLLQQQHPSFSTIIQNPAIYLPLTALGLLTSIPILYRLFKSK